MATVQAPASTNSILLRERSGEPSLALNVGAATRAVGGKPNEDFFGVACPPEERSQLGVMITLADGVSANGAGRVAAEATVRSLLEDYYCAPAAWSRAHSIERLLRATNDWLFGQNRHGQGSHGILATVSALVLCGGRFFIAHVGDTRIYRLRNAQFEQLTVDHTWPGRDMRRVLKRAVGLDTHLVVDFDDGETRAGDVFLLVSDGVWDTLGDRKLRSLLDDAADPQHAADSIVAASADLQATYLGRNDASAMVARLSPADA
jgi:serine/threonine protein phosphatase PrpC